ncbi:MAG: HAMP domain-containing sensor histidine kinase [Candidatus Sulfotelmatobacter sp.]
MGVLEKLPTCMIVGVLVMIFACLKRHTRCARLTLWAVGWTLVFTHFLAQLLEPAGHAILFLRAVDAGALQCSAVAFLVSVSSLAEDRVKRTVALLALAVPSVTYAVLDASCVHSRWPYALLLIACFSGAACSFFWVKRGFSVYLADITLLCSVAGAWALRAALNGSFHEGTMVLLGIGFALPGVFICRNYWDASPAVLTISVGFFCWGAVFPILFLAGRFAPNMILPNALWDTPKLFVAFGMILAVVEDKSHAIVRMQHRAAELNRQSERFSAITSRLLTSPAPDTVCPEIASTITEFSSFHAALIHIETPEGTLRIAGTSGPSQEFLRMLQKRTEHWTAGDLQNFCSDARRIGKTSFFLPSNRSSFGVAGCRSNDACLQSSTELLIPLGSAAGACLGSITLAAPCDESAICVQELDRIESLAADLAIAVAMKSLHTQLVWSEKLAAMGQLVAGVAHELNNPLTAIMGFGELMSDAITSARTSDQLKRLMSETRRMKRITDNLLRFSRQSSADANMAHLSPVVQEVLTLCEYYTRTLKVYVETDIAPNLPLLAINEDEIKQVLLNLFNNSCDALQGVTGSKQIKIRAYQDGARAVIQVEDTGPGFSNLNRALDPFYTTKPVGKGTGLGLSVCYGIAKRRGGDLRIENVKPHGGRVTLVVPVIEPRSQSILVKTAHA